MNEPVIRLYTCNASIVTAEEYEQIKRDVEARALAKCSEVGDRVLARLLIEHAARYAEVRQLTSTHR